MKIGISRLGQVSLPLATWERGLNFSLQVSQLHSALASTVLLQSFTTSLPFTGWKSLLMFNQEKEKPPQVKYWWGFYLLSAPWVLLHQYKTYRLPHKLYVLLLIYSAAHWTEPCDSPFQSMNAILALLSAKHSFLLFKFMYYEASHVCSFYPFLYKQKIYCGW